MSGLRRVWLAVARWGLVLGWGLMLSLAGQLASYAATEPTPTETPTASSTAEPTPEPDPTEPVEPVPTVTETVTETASPEPVPAAPGVNSGTYVDPATGAVRMTEKAAVALGVGAWLLGLLAGLGTAVAVLP